MTTAMGTSRRPARAPGRQHRVHPSDFACKQTMAVTGLVLALFVLVHMVGNLKAYLGPRDFDDYALWLRHLLEPLLPYAAALWGLRVVLATCLLAHLAGAHLLWTRARAARGPHRRRGLPLRSFAARTMPVTGVLLLLFVALHVLDLTTGTRPVAPGGYTAMTSERSLAYENLVQSLQRPWAAAVYVLAMAALGLHLAHGLWLALNDLGATGRRVRQVGLVAAGAVAIAVTVGNMTLPIAVQLGVVS